MTKKRFDEHAAMAAIEAAVAERKPIKPVLKKLADEMETHAEAVERIETERAKEG